MGMAQWTPQGPCEGDPVFSSWCKAFAKEQEQYDRQTGREIQQQHEKQAQWERQQEMARLRRVPTRYFYQWNHATGKVADINDLSAETLVQIFCDLDGHCSNFRTLTLTCRRFRELLVSDEYRIAYYKDQKAEGFERLILENTTIPYSPLTGRLMGGSMDAFKWFDRTSGPRSLAETTDRIRGRAI